MLDILILQQAIIAQNPYQTMFNQLSVIQLSFITETSYFRTVIQSDINQIKTSKNTTELLNAYYYGIKVNPRKDQH